ncbi:MAG: hypothetical protein AAFO74_15735 [Pseudomonadota bacterium]
MSSLPPLSLPKFHVNALSQAHKDAAKVEPSIPDERSFSAASDEDQAETELEQETAPEPELPMAPILPEIDTGAILNSLEQVKVGLERAALQHSQALISEFLQSAFPKLCESLLADEVVKATQSMAPTDLQRLIINVPDKFEGSFQRAVQASPEMNEICDIRASGDGDAITIDVDWQTGGLNFDMDQFLDSSLARLAGPNQSQEGHDV